jgi:hypothetical protein
LPDIELKGVESHWDGAKIPAMKIQRDEDEPDPFALAMACRAEYNSIAAAYDSALLDAHNAGHGTAEIIRHLRRANDMGPAMLKALECYQEAVALLAKSFQKK